MRAQKRQGCLKIIYVATRITRCFAVFGRPLCCDEGLAVFIDLKLDAFELFVFDDNGVAQADRAALHGALGIKCFGIKASCLDAGGYGIDHLAALLAFELSVGQNADGGGLGYFRGFFLIA